MHDAVKGQLEQQNWDLSSKLSKVAPDAFSHHQQMAMSEIHIAIYCRISFARQASQ